MYGSHHTLHPQYPKPEETKYTEAFELIEKGDYAAAYAIFTELGDYKNAKAEASRFHYVVTSETLNCVDAEGNAYSITGTPTYNEENIATKFVCTYTGLAEYTYTCVYTYNERGQLVNALFTDTAGNVENADNTYYANGDLFKEFYVEADGSIYVRTYVYDEHGNEIKQEYYNTEGFYSVSEFTYNEDGYMTKSVSSWGDEEPTVCIFTLDENNLVVKEEYLDANGNIVEAYNYIYDENGNCVKVDLVLDGVATTVTEFTYDEKGNRLTETFTYGDDYSITTAYTYDGNGNVIKLVETTRDGDTVTVVERVSEYKLVYVPYDYCCDYLIEIVDCYWYNKI